MKPYLVEITTIAVVMARDGDHADDVARHIAREAIADDCRPAVTVLTEVNSLRDLTDKWDAKCVPYGGDGNTTLGEVLASNVG